MTLEWLHRFSLLGRRCAAVNSSGQVLLDTDDGATLMTAEGEALWTHPVAWPYTCALAEDGVAYVGNRTFNSGPSSLVRVSAEGKKSSRKLPFDELGHLALSADGAALIALSSGKDTKPRLYDTAKLSQEPVALKKGNRAGSMRQAAWSPSGQRLLTLAEKSWRTPMHSIAVRDIHAKRGLLWHGIADFAVLASDTRLVTWERGYADTIQLWDLDAGEDAPPLATQHFPGIRGGALGCMVALPGGRVIVAQNRQLYVLEAETLALVAEISGKAWSSDDATMGVSPNGRYLLLSTTSGTHLLSVER